MLGQLRQVLNRGTKTPAVARTFFQGKDVIQVLNGTDAQNDQAMMILRDLMEALVRCVEIQEEIDQAVEIARVEVNDGSLMARQQPGALRPPTVPNLKNKAESFVQGAKLAVAHATRLTEPYYGRAFGHKLNKMADWASSELGDQHSLTLFARDWQPWVIGVLDMRDAVDHPTSEPRGRLHVRNFSFDERPGGVVLTDPQWWLEGDPAQSMNTSMANIIEGVLQLQEHLLGVIFHDFKANAALRLCEIPVDQRDPECPMRLRIDLDFTMLKPADTGS
jgi:hypothetical protein